MKGFFLIMVLMLSSVVGASMDKYEKVVEKYFPGYVILKKKEFNNQLIKVKQPGLIAGKFNQDKFTDFAAMIRTNIKKRYGSGDQSYEYYEGRVVVCHGKEDGAHNCHLISEFPITIPQESYLEHVKPKNTWCYKDDGTKELVNVKTDAIGWYYPGKGGSHYLFQGEGRYRNCVVSD